MKYLADFIAWAIEHPILALILVYTVICMIDLFAPMDTSRGSWWNLYAWVLRLMCLTVQV